MYPWHDGLCTATGRPSSSAEQCGDEWVQPRTGGVARHRGQEKLRRPWTGYAALKDYTRRGTLMPGAVASIRAVHIVLGGFGSHTFLRPPVMRPENLTSPLVFIAPALHYARGMMPKLWKCPDFDRWKRAPANELRN